MTILQSLNNYYDRMERRKEVPPIGYSSQQIGYTLVLRP